MSHPSSSGHVSNSNLTSLRRHFPILDETTYLISNSLGAMPTEAQESVDGYLAEWRRRGVRAWHEGWWELPVEVGDLVAPFLGVGAGEVSMQPNVTLATSIFLSALDFPAERNRIVYTELNFPSLRYLLQGQKDRGAEIVVVPSDDGIGIEIERLLDEIDERTRLVPISHVLFKSGFVQDVARVARRCREVGALLLVDVYQSAGIMPLELSSWKIDAAVGGCLKWLCGGPGSAFLWVRPGLDRELEPRTTGWQSHVAPFDFAAGHRRVPHGAWRFLTGTPNVPALKAAIPGLQLLGALDLTLIRQRSLQLTDTLIERATEAGFQIQTPLEPERRGGTVTIALEHAEELCQALLGRDILCDYRPGAGIRFSPHFYNTREECEHAVDALVELSNSPW